MAGLSEVVMGAGELEKIVENVAVDQEWIALIISAKDMGITIEEIRLFLNDED